MKKVLIICDTFPPAFAPRMGYLCRYMYSLGWEPIVLTEDADENTFTFLANECPVTYINYYTASRKFLLRLQWISTFILDFCSGYKDRRMAKEADKLLKQQHFDLLLCSTYRTFPLKACYKTAQKHHLPFVADLRDIIEQYSGYEFIKHGLPERFGINKIFATLFKYKNLKERNRVLQKANAVTTVSPWHVQTLQAYNPQTKLIYNGFDPDLFHPEQIKTDRFVITYTGRLLSTAMRDPSLFLEGLSILQSKKILTPGNCRVRWYMDEYSRQIIETEAKKMGISSFMEFNDYIPASEVPLILNTSSVLLLLTNKSGETGPKGVMTTKFFEFLAVEKPILCVRSDESLLEKAIREAHAGVAARRVEEVCDFLQDCFTEWKEKGYTSSSIRKEILQNYSRKKQAHQFIDLFEQVTTS